MRNTGHILIACLFVAGFLCYTPASAQYGSNNSSNTGNSGNNTSGNTKGKSTGNSNTNPNDRRRQNVGTSVDEETDAQREERRDQGNEQAANKAAPPGIASGPEVVGMVDEIAYRKLTPEHYTAVIDEYRKFGDVTPAKVNG